MLSPLDLMSSSFHAFNIATLIFVGRLWHHRYAEEPVIRPLPMHIAKDLAVVSLIALLSAGIFGAAGVAGRHELGALLSEWRIAELPVLLGMIVVVSRRRGMYAASLG